MRVRECGPRAASSAAGSRAGDPSFGLYPAVHEAEANEWDSA
jgi:hypothetical protein